MTVAAEKRKHKFGTEIRESHSVELFERQRDKDASAGSSQALASIFEGLLMANTDLNVGFFSIHLSCLKRWCDV